MAEKYWQASEISEFTREFDIRQLFDSVVHPDGRFAEGCCIGVPPPYAYLLALMPIFVPEEHSGWQTLLWSFQQYLSSGVC